MTDQYNSFIERLKNPRITMNTKLLSWSDYIYIGLSLAMLLSGRDEHRDGFYQLILVGVFFVCTGLKDNIRTLIDFSKKYPLFAIFTAIWTIYFGFIHRPDIRSDRFAITVFGVIFGAYCLSQKGEELITLALKKLWMVLLVSVLLCDCNFVITKFSQGRMSLFFLNTNIEGYALISFLLISILFTNERRMTIAGIIVSVISVLGTGSKSCTLMVAVIVAGYLVVHIKDFKEFARKNKRKAAILTLLVIITAIISGILMAKFAGNLFIQLKVRYLQGINDIMNLKNGSQMVDYYSSTNFRMFDIKVALETFPKGSIIDVIIGRGMLQQYYHAIRPIVSRIFSMTYDGVGPAENTFLSIMYDYGAASFVMLLGTFISAFVLAFKSKSNYIKKLSIILICLMILNMTVDMEYWTNIMYVVWIFIGLYLGALDEKIKKKVLAPSMIFCCFLILMIYLLPTANAYLKTLENGHSIVGSGSFEIEYKLVAGVIILALVTIAIVISMIVGRLYADKSYNKTELSICIIAVVALSAGILISDNLIQVVRKSVADRIYSEKDIIESIKENANGKIYVNTYPEAYDKELGGISKSVLYGRELVCYDDITIITDIGTDSYRYGDKGLLYLPISEKDAIYTNDEGVINYFRNKGKWLTGYNYHTESIDVSGRENSRDITTLMYTGVYTVTLDLSIKKSNEESGDVCTIEIYPDSNDGTGVDTEADAYASVIVPSSDFDSQDSISFEMNCNIPTTGRVHFIIDGGEKYGLEINGIEYRRTPEYDKQVKINEFGDVLLEKYYDLEGNPYMDPAGYYGIRYEYDDMRRMTRLEYLDKEWNPTVVESKGYAILCREYNGANQITREEYRGSDNELLVLGDGQAAVEYEYNEKGQNIYETYYGNDDEPIALSNGAFGYKREYDDAGHIVKFTYVGENGEPTLNTSNYSSWRRVFNDDNIVVREEYYDENDNPIEVSTGQHSVEYEYDENNNRIIDRFYDVEGNPVLYNGQYFYVKRIYNEDGTLIDEEYYDIDGNIVNED